MPSFKSFRSVVFRCIVLTYTPTSWQNDRYNRFVVRVAQDTQMKYLENQSVIQRITKKMQHQKHLLHTHSTINTLTLLYLRHRNSEICSCIRHPYQLHSALSFYCNTNHNMLHSYNIRTKDNPHSRSFRISFGQSPVVFKGQPWSDFNGLQLEICNAVQINKKNSANQTVEMSDNIQPFRHSKRVGRTDRQIRILSPPVTVLTRDEKSQGDANQSIKFISDKRCSI